MGTPLACWSIGVGSPKNPSTRAISPEVGSSVTTSSALHQRATVADHVPSVAQPIVVVVDLRRDDEPVLGLAPAELLNGRLELDDPDERVARIVPLDIDGHRADQMAADPVGHRLVPCCPVRHQHIGHRHVPLASPEPHRDAEYALRAARRLR